MTAPAGPAACAQRIGSTQCSELGENCLNSSHTMHTLQGVPSSLGKRVCSTTFWLKGDQGLHRPAVHALQVPPGHSGCLSHRLQHVLQLPAGRSLLLCQALAGASLLTTAPHPAVWLILSGPVIAAWLPVSMESRVRHICRAARFETLHTLLRLLRCKGSTSHRITGGRDLLNPPCYALVSCSDLASRIDL